MTDIIKRVRELVEEKIAEMEYTDLFIVDIKMAANRLNILLDADSGAQIAQCAAISRHVGYHLEQEEAIADAYNLEVSSPGLDQPLLLHRQYLKNIGRNVEVKLNGGLKKEGKLLAATEQHILIVETLKEKGKKVVEQETTIPFTEVAEVKGDREF